MRTGIIIVGLALAVAAGGVYLLREVGDDETPHEHGAPVAAAPSRPNEPVRRSLGDDHPRVVMPPRRNADPTVTGAAPSTTVTSGTRTEATIDLPPGVPGLRVDLRKTPAPPPGVDDDSARVTGMLDGPVAPPLSPELAEALGDARAQIRDGDPTAARSVAHKILAEAPGASAARRLAVSASCQLGDEATARADAAELSRNEHGALRRYCQQRGVDLGPPQ